MSDAAESTIRRWPPRFSLLTAILLTTILAMGLAIALLWREIGPLRNEVQTLRDETGQLTIDDETKPYVIQVRTADDMTWKWRIWIPKGQKYTLKYAGESIPKNGFPAARANWELNDPGETWIDFHIAFDPKSQKWQGTFRTPQMSFSALQQDWVDWPHRNRVFGEEGTDYKTESRELGKIVVLHRERATEGSEANMPDPAAGFMIWLEPIK